jgi:hypothetical protein
MDWRRSAPNKPAEPSIWPGFPRGDAQTIRVVGPYAYIGLSHGGRADRDVKAASKFYRVRES